MIIRYEVARSDGEVVLTHECEHADEWFPLSLTEMLRNCLPPGEYVIEPSGTAIEIRETA